MLKGVGLYVGRNEVVAVSAIRTRSGPQITSFAVEPIGLEGSSQSHPEGGFRGGKRTPPEAQAILKVLTTIKERGAFVNVAVSPLQVVTRNFIMPVVPKKDEVSAVHNEASRYVPFKITDSMLDYHAYPTHKNVLSVTVTAIRNEILNEYLENLHAASAKVLVMEPVYNAASRVFSALNMIGKVQAHGFVILQSDGNVNVTLASKGVVYLSRDFLLSGRLEDDKSRFFSELKASMEYFYKLTGGESIEQIFLSGVGDLKVWVEHLEHAFNYTVRFDVANLPRAKNLPPEALHELLVPFGLALRSLGYRSSLGPIQLLPKADRRSDPPQFLKFVTVEFFLILVFFIVIRFVIFQPYLMSLKNQKEAFIGPAAQEFATFASRSMEDLQGEKDVLNGKIALLNGFFNSKMSAVAFLMALGQGLPKSISLDYVSLEDATGAQPSESGKSQKRLNVRGICYLGNAEKETETVGTWLKALGAKKIMAENFGEIRVEEIKREKFRNREVTRFRGVGE